MLHVKYISGIYFECFEEDFMMVRNQCNVYLSVFLNSRYWGPWLWLVTFSYVVYCNICKLAGCEWPVWRWLASRGRQRGRVCLAGRPFAAGTQGWTLGGARWSKDFGGEGHGVIQGHLVPMMHVRNSELGSSLFQAVMCFNSLRTSNICMHQ